MNLKKLITIVAILFSVMLLAFGHYLAAPICLCLAMAPLHIGFLPGCADATLIVPILTGKVMEAFKFKVPSLDFFSTDLGKTGGQFVQPVKFGQEVISQLASVPTVSEYIPGTALAQSTQSAKTLVTDLKVKIDRARAVHLRLPSQDIQQLLVMPAFMQALVEAGQALGRDVVSIAVAAANPPNFSNRKVVAAANTDLDTLEDARVALNLQKALTPRYVLGSTDFLSKIMSDPRVMNKQFYDQRTEGNPYTSLVNIKGFNEVMEMPNFPTGNQALCTFTANASTDTCTLVAVASGVVVGHPATATFPIANGMRVQVSSTSAIPGGLAAVTNYYVVGANSSAGTFQLSASWGGAAIDITDAGSGTLTLTGAENLNAFAFEKRAIHIAVRPMIDPSEAARQLGIPTPMLTRVEVDPITGLSMTVFLWQDCAGTQPTLDIFASFVVQFGVRAGRGIGGNVDPAADAAGSAFDNAGLRIITA